MLKRIGGSAINPDLVTYIDSHPNGDGIVVHFVGGSNKLFVREDAEAVKALLLPKDKHEEDAG